MSVTFCVKSAPTNTIEQNAISQKFWVVDLCHAHDTMTFGEIKGSDLISFCFELLEHFDIKGAGLSPLSFYT